MSPGFKSVFKNSFSFIRNTEYNLFYKKLKELVYANEYDFPRFFNMGPKNEALDNIKAFDHFMKKLLL